MGRPVVLRQLPTSVSLKRVKYGTLRDQLARRALAAQGIHGVGILDANDRCIVVGVKREWSSDCSGGPRCFSFLPRIVFAPLGVGWLIATPWSGSGVDWPGWRHCPADDFGPDVVGRT
jgi:hypothetical protein